MNRQTLYSLIKLFAISINKGSDLPQEKIIEKFRYFLNITIEDKYVQEFLSEFCHALDDFASFSAKRLSLNSVRLIKICNDTKNILSQNERLQVVFYLYFLLQNVDNKESNEFVHLVADLYEIDVTAYENLKNIFDANTDNAIDIYDENEIVGCFSVLNDKYIAVKSCSNNIVINNEAFNGEVRLVDINSVVYCGKRKMYFNDFWLQTQKHAEKFKLKIDNLSVIKQEKTLLKPFSCEFSSGELVGVIGKSGSGKTTLLQVLSGVNKKFSGSFYKISNDTISEPSKAYLPQVNTSIPLFTVKEHLEQRLRFLQKNSNADSEIDAALAQVELSEYANNIVAKADGTIWQISGGQQKRLGIAMEMLANPDVLILDEPTSGLSSTDAHSIVNVLRKIAIKQKIVVASIHQPDYETLMMFDKIVIIDEGYLIFYGTPTQAANYFRQQTGKIDKASLLETFYDTSIILNLISETNSQQQRLLDATEWNKRWNKLQAEQGLWQTKSKNFQHKKTKSLKLSFIQSFLDELKFSFTCDYKNKLRLFFILVIPFVMASLMSVLTRFSLSNNYEYYSNPNIPAWLMMLLITGFFIGLVVAGHEFIFLRQFHRNEHIIYNKTVVLSIAKIVKYLIYSAVIALILILPAVVIIKCYYLFPILFTTTWLLVFCGNLFSMLMSVFFKVVSVVYLLIPLLVVPQMIFSGGLIQFEHFNKTLVKLSGMPYFAALMPIRWADEAVLTATYMQNPVEKEVFDKKVSLYKAQSIDDIVRKQAIRQEIDYKLSRIEDCDSIYKQYSNMFVTQIVTSAKTTNNSIPSIYNISANNTFLCGRKYFLGLHSTFFYNSAIMLLYDAVLCILLVACSLIKKNDD